MGMQSFVVQRRKNIQGEGITNLVIKLAEHENNPIKHKSDFMRGLYIIIHHSKTTKTVLITFIAFE